MSEKEPGPTQSQVEIESESRTKARRKILRTLVAGGGAVTAARITSDDWVKPVIESVVLPSHAQTSVVGPAGNFASATVTVVEVLPEIDSLLAEQPISDELLEFFMPSAHAQSACNLSCDVQFRLQIAPDFSAGALCVEGDTNATAELSGVSATRFDGTTLGGITVSEGTFTGGTWSINVVQSGSPANVATTVQLSSGGAGCGIA